ncbi:hypothetical protein HMPREF9454_00572 [Megamonas funiformis YIT 11815]|jgi:hypothetical protein|uniref:Ribbon-helix-helix protein CopG domain-containing protein n=1 Tax=Megamonas funiformis YIT 11815 TaxID=742816 RepID=A0ABN0EKI9_9FIRM|nr:hypothetical protein [Megamonas funiformis]EHR38767.1 hypothetical protein HMPREF9454_00572 [Megamonas funiformis YIT 11815]
MPTKLKRITFAVTPDIENILDEAKKFFYNRSQSEMLRILILEGLASLKKKNKIA